jgi:gliding motility-associated-like protein
MFNKYSYILLLCTVLGKLTAQGQKTMPDSVIIGETSHYNVVSDPASTYIWWINGVIQPGFNTNEFVYTWNTLNTYLLEVQEYSADGCPGPVMSGQVFVVPLPVPHGAGLRISKAFSPNNDGINDAWEIGNINLYPELEVIIYNRWGQLVWKSGRGYPVPWDGTGKGDRLPMDSYHYIIDLHNGKRPIIGNVTIVR